MIVKGLNYNKINKILEESKHSKRYIAERCHISRPCLDGLLRGGDTKVTTLVSIANFFNLPISYFFDEETPTNHIEAHDRSNAAGRDINIGSADTVQYQEKIALLEQRIADKDEILADKERLIKILLEGRNQ